MKLDYAEGDLFWGLAFLGVIYGRLSAVRKRGGCIGRNVEKCFDFGICSSKVLRIDGDQKSTFGNTN